MLSIILTSFNYAQYLQESIESVITQDYENYELIIIDDASTDNSLEIAKDYAAKHSQIRLIQNIQNEGLFRGIEKGVKAAKGKYLFLFAADDKLGSGFLKELMGMFLQFPELQLVCSDFSYFSDHKVDEKKLLELDRAKVFSNLEILQVFKNSHFWVPGPSAIYTKEAWQRYGGFNSKLINLSDWFFLQKVALFEGVGYVPKTLSAMRLHGSSYTSQIKKDKKKRRDVFRYLLKLLKSDKETKKLFEEAKLLDPIFKELYIRLAINPLYSSYWPYLYKNFRR